MEKGGCALSNLSCVIGCLLVGDTVSSMWIVRVRAGTAYLFSVPAPL